MSKETWLKEFMPTTADALATAFPTDEEKLIEHSLRKWEGRRPENLAKHDLPNHGEMPTTFDGSDCTLCIAYYIPAGEREYEDDCGCTNCPLYEVLGHPCDSDEPDDHNVYAEARSGLPGAMIDALTEALNRARKAHTDACNALWALTGVVAVTQAKCLLAGADICTSRPMIVAQQGGRGVVWDPHTQESRTILKAVRDYRGKLLYYEVL